MTKGVLIGNQIDAELPTSGVQLEDFCTSESPPVSPDGFIVSIGKSVLGIELKFIYLKTSEMFDQLQQCAELWDTATGDIKHDAAARKIGIIPNDDMGQSTAVLQHELTQGRDSSAQAFILTILDAYTF